MALSTVLKASLFPILCPPGLAAMQPGDQVRLTLDTQSVPGLPDTILGVIQTPVAEIPMLNGSGCRVTGVQYEIEYESDDLDDALEALRPDDILSMACVSCCQSLREDLDVEIEARIAADTEESQARIAADTAESQARIAADTAESQARIAADAAEAQARIAADTAESQARIAADAEAAPITRTAAQGPPVDESLASFTYTDDHDERNGNYVYLGTFEINQKVFARDDGTVEIVDDLLTGSGYAFVQRSGPGNQWTLEESSDFATLSPSVLVISNQPAEDPAQVAVWDEVMSWMGDPTVSDPVYSGGTAAAILDHACIVGDAGKNKLEYRAVQLAPTRWQLVTAGVIWNEDEEQFEKLIVRDGTIQTDIYPLT